MDVIRREGYKMAEEFIDKYDSTSSVNEIWSTIESRLLEILSLVPYKMTSTRYHQPWVNRKMKQLSRQKQRAYKKILFLPTPEEDAYVGKVQQSQETHAKSL